MLSPPDGLAPTPATTGRRRSGGFTLVELLMVIGIIAVLAALVLTVRSRASDQARAAQCMNNLRQIGMAMTLYAQNNNQAFPFSSHFNTPADPPKVAGEDRKADWIHFRATEDDLQKKVNQSAIATHAKVKGPAFITMMRCPGDEIESHPTNPTARFPYRFSYTMNVYMASDDMAKGLNRGATPRVTAISRPGEKILVVEETSGTINDGAWEPGAYQSPLNRQSAWNCSPNFLSIRHDVRNSDNRLRVDAEGNLLLDPSKRGNVLFVDGHAEFVSRLYAHTAKHLLVTDEGTGVPQVQP